MQIPTEIIEPGGVQELVDVSKVTPWDVLWAALLVVGGLVASRLIRVPLRKWMLSKTRLQDITAHLIAKVAGWAVVTLAIVFALPLIGVDVTPVVILLIVLVAVIVVSGRVVLENYGAGVILQAEAAFHPGDQIATNDYVGRVLEVSSRSLMMDTVDGKRIVIPNNKVIRDPVEVLTTHPQRRGELVVGLEYGTNLDRARQVLAEAAQDADGVAADPPVEVFVTEFGDSSIDFLVWFWHASDILSGVAATDEVARSIDRACREHGLTIAFPQRTLWWGEPGAAEGPEG